MKLTIFFLNWIVSLYLITTPSNPFKLYDTSYATVFTPRFASSIYELGVRSLDPLYIDFIQINHGGLKLDLHNVQITGLKNTIIKNVNIDKNSRLLRLTLLIDYTLKSQYNAAGYIFSLPVFGNGDLSKTNTNVEIDMVMPFEIIKDGYGRDIIDLKGYQYSFMVKRAGSIFLTNLYNGSNLSSDSMHALINQNWKLWYAEYEKFIYDKLNDKIFNAVRTYLNSQPLETISLAY